MNPQEALAKSALDTLIRKSRAHFYKPIQIAEILYRDRVVADIDLAQLETYRIRSKHWRDEVCFRFLGRISSSSAKYQDDLFNNNAIPPSTLSVLGAINRAKNGAVEAYIYHCFNNKLAQMSTGLGYVEQAGVAGFALDEFLNLFWQEPGLKRSIDKIYEIVVYALFSALVDALEVSVEVSLNIGKTDLLREFQDFAQMVIHLSPDTPSFKQAAKIHRVGVTNAADRGLDMFANFGLAIQIKHLSLTEELAEGIVNQVSADRIVIVCKTSEKNLIVSLLNQIGWKSRIQSIITEEKLIEWYEKALRGAFSVELGEKILANLRQEIALEFPVTNNPAFSAFLTGRGYVEQRDPNWLASHLT